LKRVKPYLIGFGCTTPSINNANKLADIAKNILPNVLTIVGGAHVTAIPKKTLEEFPSFDFGCIGEGEETFLEVCKRVKKNESIKGTKGLVHRYLDKILIEQKRPLIKDLDKIPFPARDLVDISRYKIAYVSRGISRKFMNIMEIITSRGCPYNCIFCANPDYLHEVRFRSVENIRDEVMECIKKYKTKHITINDSNFTIHPQINEICKVFKDLNITWDCLTRINLVTEEMIDTMVKSGCIRICFGVESGSPRILKLSKKNITLDQIKKVFKWAHKSKLDMIFAAFMIGSHPNENMDDIKMTIKLINEIKPHIWSLTIMVPYPGTEIYNMMKDKGYIKTKNWDDYEIYMDAPKWRTDFFTGEELLKVQKWAVKKTYMHPRHLLQLISRIKGWEEFKYYADVGFNLIKTIFINK